MRRIDVRRAWAPPNGRWSTWVRPELFTQLNVYEPELGPVPPAPPWLERRIVRALTPPLAAYRSERTHDAGIVIDLPGAAGTWLGVALAERGFRPVPLYNARSAPNAVVDVLPIVEALVDGSAIVEASSASAPPVFLLDARRRGIDRAVAGGAQFDNRSLCRASDVPSAATLSGAGLKRMLVVCDAIAADLEPILLGWQAAGIALWKARPDDGAEAAPFVLRRRSWLRRALDLSLVVPRASADGSYGHVVGRPPGPRGPS